MNDEETLKRFILMRSEGHSFNTISMQLKVSKPTLIKWSRQHQFEIQNLRATQTEELAETVFKPKHERWRSLAKHLSLVEEEIAKRDMEEMTLPRLFSLAASLRAEIKRELGPIHFSETTKEIPNTEFVIDTHKWEA